MFLNVTKLRGNVQLAKEMVAKSGRRNVQDTPVPVRVLWHGYTPLHWAAYDGDVSAPKPPIPMNEFRVHGTVWSKTYSMIQFSLPSSISWRLPVCCSEFFVPFCWGNSTAFFADLIGPNATCSWKRGPCKSCTENLQKHELHVPCSRWNNAGLQESALRLCFDFRRGPEHLPRVEQLFWAHQGAAGETPLDSGRLVDQRLLDFWTSFQLLLAHPSNDIARMKSGFLCLFCTCHISCNVILQDSDFSQMFNTSAGQSPLCLRQAVCESYERGMLHEKLFLGGPVRVKCIHFFARKLPNCPELLPCVSLTFVAPKVRTSSKLPPLMYSSLCWGSTCSRRRRAQKRSSH